MPAARALHVSIDCNLETAISLICCRYGQIFVPLLLMSNNNLFRFSFIDIPTIFFNSSCSRSIGSPTTLVQEPWKSFTNCALYPGFHRLQLCPLVLLSRYTPRFCASERSLNQTLVLSNKTGWGTLPAINKPQ